MKSIIRKLIPTSLLLEYHRGKALLASKIFGNPSADMTVIGITGTKGKSTTANFVWAALQAGGMKTGLIGTANIRIGDMEMVNPYHMTMPSPMVLQKIFKQMKEAGCTAVVMEVTSEGILQHRQKGINFDIGVFTNLSPEHLPSHNNSFEEYKKTKKKFFNWFADSGKKIFVNSDDAHANFFLEVSGVQKICTTLEGDEKNKEISGKILSITENSTKFLVNGRENYEIFIGGTKNVENALLAVAIAKNFSISAEKIQNGFENLQKIPGRMEKIDQGQKFSVFVDYAHEEKSMDFLMETGKNIAKNKGGKIIVLLGAEGGGRDKSKRPKMGRIVAEKADLVVVSNVDPYLDDPTEICEDIAKAAQEYGKVRGKDLFVIEDRQKGIEKCISLASENDTVFITGKGSEQSMVIGGKEVPWDDREVVKSVLSQV